MTDEGWLITLTTHGNWSHIGSIGLENNAVEGHTGGKHFGQMAFLKCGHSADTKDKLRELQQLAGFLLVAGKAVEHSTRQFACIPF